MAPKATAYAARLSTSAARVCGGACGLLSRHAQQSSLEPDYETLPRTLRGSAFGDFGRRGKGGCFLGVDGCHKLWQRVGVRLTVV